jgi:c-di-GMP-binding flagellar brake protein YcgR
VELNQAADSAIIAQLVDLSAGGARVRSSEKCDVSGEYSVLICATFRGGDNQVLQLQGKILRESAIEPEKGWEYAIEFSQSDDATSQSVTAELDRICIHHAI